MFAEQGAHGAVALAERMDVLDRNGKRGGVENHVRHVEPVVTLGDDEQLIGLRIVVAILDGDVVCGIDRLDEVIETTVTDERDSAGDVKSKVIDVMLVCHRQLDLKVSIVYVSTLHVDEKLFTQMVFKLLNTFRDVFQRETEF